MKNKNVYIIFIILLLIILIAGYFTINYLKNKKNNNNTQIEYVPEKEITDEQLRQTIVSLYFPAKENNELQPEARIIDIKEIINNPYEKLANLLIEGPKNEKLNKIIPDNTKLLKNYLEGDCVVLDFSSEFLNFNKDNKSILLDSIVNTLTELTEVNKVKILIDGNENAEFNEIYERKK